MARQHANSVTGIFQTPFGQMDYAITSGIHAHVSAGASGDRSPMIVVNRISYYTSAHLIDKPDGWGFQYIIHMSREGSGGGATGPAEAKARTGILDAWAAFINVSPQLLIEGEIRGLNNEILSADDNIEGLRQKIRALTEEREGLLGREREAYEARAEFTRKGGYPKSKDWSPSGQVPEE